MDVIVSLAKRRGFVFPSSEIYGGMAGFWDYGPLGVELKNNVKQAWWRAMVQRRDDIAGLDAAVMASLPDVPFRPEHVVALDLRVLALAWALGALAALVGAWVPAARASSASPASALRA